MEEVVFASTKNAELAAWNAVVVISVNIKRLEAVVRSAVVPNYANMVHENMYV